MVFPCKRKVNLETVDTPDKLKPTEILVRNTKTLVSAGTELSLYLGTHLGLKDPKNKWAKYPFYPGYAGAGTVEDTGNSVDDIKPGDRVVSESRHESLSAVDTSFRSVLVIPESVSFAQASFFKLGGVALNAIRRARIELGDSVVIIGQGLVGQLALQLAKLSGARPVVAVDTVAQRLDVSKKAKADYVLNPLTVDIKERVCDITNGEKARVVIDATGTARAISEAVKLVRKEGSIILLGSPRETVELDLYTEIHKYGIFLIGAHEATCPSIETDSNPWTRIKNQELILELIREGSLRVEDLITQRREPDEAEQVYKGLANEQQRFLGVIFSWLKEQK